MYYNSEDFLIVWKINLQNCTIESYEAQDFSHENH
jgi:hypothetical protein